MIIHDIQQGSPEWMRFRAVHFGASEAAAMLGLSSYMTRSELLRLKHTGIEAEHSSFKERILANGHRVEEVMRGPTEEAIGSDLYPVTCSLSGSRISASCDGLTLEGDTAWECKQWNAELAAAVAAGSVPDTHMPQCQQILLVTSAKRVRFTVSDGTPEKTVHTEVTPDPEWFARIARGWAQFEADLAVYTPPEAAPVVTAAPQEHLPAVSVQLSGALSVASNLAPFGVALRAFIAKIPAKPATDQEFADTEAACKRLKEAEDRLQAAEDSALAGMADVEAMRRMVAEFRELARTTRLSSEKLVKQRKEQIREEEVQRGARALVAHITQLNTRLGGMYVTVQAEFGSAIKGLKTIDSVRNAIDTELARCKIEASALAEKIDANLKTLHGYLAPGVEGLFHDRATLVLKAPDDLAAVIAQRIGAERQRREAERERIANEERARLEREQVAAAQAPAPARAGVDHGSLSTPAAAAPLMQRPAMQAMAPIVEAPPINISEISRRLGFTITAQFIEGTLQIGRLSQQVKTIGVYWRAEQFTDICDALVAHIEGLK